jgi:hypothetical protein
MTRAKATLAGSKRDHTGQIRSQMGQKIGPGLNPLGQATDAYAGNPGGPYVGTGPSLGLPK